jgi:hypothetical protein
MKYKIFHAIFVSYWKVTFENTKKMGMAVVLLAQKPSLLLTNGLKKYKSESFWKCFLGGAILFD